jgi:cell wall-associated NlpC family hydrolase
VRRGTAAHEGRLHHRQCIDYKGNGMANTMIVGQRSGNYGQVPDNNARYRETGQWPRQCASDCPSDCRIDSSLSPGMVFFMGFHQLSLSHMGVYLSGGNVRVTQHHLYGTKVGATFKQMGGKRMP